MNEKSGFVRKRFTPAERSKIVAEYKASGMTQGDFARRAGISLACLSIWLRRQRQSEQTLLAPRPSNFVELGFLPTAPGGQAGYKIHLPGGLCLELPRGFSAAEAGQLLQLARAL